MGDEYIITLCIGFVIFVVIVKFLSHYYYYSAPLPTDINLKRLFGSNVAFSVVMPGTTVLPHYGPTNIRLRAHLGLQVPAECHMVVNNTRVEWKEGQIVCFDETFLHHVKHEGTPESLPRVILIVDLWHPNLTVEQQKMIDYA
nr:hypothetical protein BaRGS_017702 [Batillaria attramentaria]